MCIQILCVKSSVQFKKKKKRCEFYILKILFFFQRVRIVHTVSDMAVRKYDEYNFKSILKDLRNGITLIQIKLLI